MPAPNYRLSRGIHRSGLKIGRHETSCIRLKKVVETLVVQQNDFFSSSLCTGSAEGRGTIVKLIFDC
jgi:hypothetical protein